ncbi:MAG: HNH endonuclease, partial [Candidatus Peribacteraceae bacterium]|nr:HNH endonuclease [Candidatus Peribacteraceae bacterium]
MKTYNKKEVYAATLSYFDDDVLATNVFIDKYCLRNKEGSLLERTPDDMHRRLAKEFARIEKKFGGKNQLKEDEIFNWLKDFKYIVPQGSVMYGLGNGFSFNSLSNCTVIESPKDSISSIINTGRDMSNLFKMRCGVGVDISLLRPDGAEVNNSARTSTGAWSFVKLYSEFVNTIGQNGRRGAGLVSIRGDHPDVIKFLSAKKDLTSSTGVNISIRLFDEFMEAVVEGKEYTLLWEDGKNKYEDIVDARELWDVLVKTATDTAEPGVLFWDRHLNYNPSSSYEELKPLTTNPCLVGATEIYVADGRGNVSIKSLAEEGKDIPVFCFNENDKIVIKYMRNPRITGYKKPVYKVILDDGSEFKITKNHKFKLKSGDYKEVKDLIPGDSLKIITKFKASIKDIFGEKARSQDYLWLNNGFKSNRAEHVYIAEFYSGKKIIPGGGEVVHHKDFDASNNSPGNLEVYKKKEHDKIHADNMRGDNNPMRRAAVEWSDEKWAGYRRNMSVAVSGSKNGRAYKVTSEDIWDHAVKLTIKKGRRFSIKDWATYSKGNELPCQFNKGGWREKESGTIVELSKKAALFCGFLNIDLDPRILATIKSIEDSGLKCVIEGKKVSVIKNCEFCGFEFRTLLNNRESCFCSRRCSSKNTWKNNRNRIIESTVQQRKEE